MIFSVIVPTRNRPDLFARALRSVLAQRGAAFEVVVVDDGSAPEHAAAYAALAAEAGEPGRFFHLTAAARGHGHGYALNFGAAQARGAYLAFLDDDDEWVDPDYLAHVARVLAAHAGAVDLHLADQAALRDGVRLERVVWIEDLAGKLAGRVPDADGAYAVGVAELLRAHGFCHLNTTVVRRDFFAALGGMEDSIRYEEDRDFYLRAIDRAGLVMYSPRVVAHHHVPDPAAGASLSTSVSVLERKLFQSRVLDRAALFATAPAIRAYGRRHKAYVLKSIARELAREGRWRLAAWYAGQALGAGFGLKWLGYAGLLWVRALLSPADAATPKRR